MTPDEKIDAEQTEVTETSDIETASEVEVTDNTDWDETPERISSTDFPSSAEPSTALFKFAV